MQVVALECARGRELENTPEIFHEIKWRESRIFEDFFLILKFVEEKEVLGACGTALSAQSMSSNHRSVIPVTEIPTVGQRGFYSHSCVGSRGGGA